MGRDPEEKIRWVFRCRSRRYFFGIGDSGRARQGELRPRTVPAWVHPPGGSQERRLSWLGALSRWGVALRDALRIAAEQHLAAGATGDWRQWEITVDDREDDDERQS